MSTTHLVRIKTCEEMEEIYGLNYSQNIAVEFVFTDQMEEALPPNRIIKIIEITPKKFIWETPERNYNISRGMIKKFIPKNSLKKLLKKGVFRKTARIEEI